MHLNRVNNTEMIEHIVSIIISIASPLLFTIWTVGWWGSNISARIKAIENKQSDLEERNEKINKKLDDMMIETNRLVNSCKDSIIKVILNMDRRH